MLAQRSLIDPLSQIYPTNHDLNIYKTDVETSTNRFKAKENRKL